MIKLKHILFTLIVIIALSAILSPINASESDLNQSDSNTILETSYGNDSILTDENVYNIGGDAEDDEEYYDYNSDPTIERASGIYHGPHSEPAIVINEFNISLGQINSNDVTIDVSFDGVLQSNIFTLDRYPLTIRENNKKIGSVPTSSVSNIDYPTDQSTPYTFTASFTYKLKNYDVELKLRLCGFESNTLIFKYIDTMQKSNLNENSIIISNKNENYTSNSSWFNTIESLENAMKLAEDNSTIYLNNIELFSNKELTINKNLTIIGNNAIINGFKVNNIFTVNSHVKFMNITFKNASDYILNINDECIIGNCTFTDTNPKVINNNASLKIIDSKFENINSVTEVNDETALVLIYNQKTLEIINSTFTNITLPNAFELNNKSIDTSYIIYNTNHSELKIYNTKFDGNNARILNNDGKTHLSQSNITNTVLLPNVIKIDTINQRINNNHILKSSMLKTATPEMILGEIYNTNQLNMTECYLENITWSYQKGLVYNLQDGQKYTWYFESKPYYKIMGFYTDRSTSFLNKAGAIYNLGELNIDKTIFNNFKASYSGTIENEGTLTINNTIINNSNSASNGGAITNRKTMTMNNTLINHAVASGAYYGNGGALYNTGNATVDNSNFTYCEGAQGEAIYNRGNADVSNSIFNSAKDSSITNFNGGVIYNHEDGNFTLFNSTIKNTRFKQASTWPTTFYGVVINEGKMDITKTIFDNNTPVSPQNIIGTYNIYNMGKMNATYNIFIYTLRSQSQTTHIYAMDSGDGLYMNYNYFDYNKNPYKIHTSMDVNRYFVLSVEPDYLPLNINDTATLNVYLKLDNGKFYTDYSKLPEMNIIINVDGKNITKTLIDGKTSIIINNTQNKGTNYVTAYYGDWNQTVQIDVGKENSSLIFEAEEIYYGENATFNMTVTGNYTHQPKGNITIIIDGKEYTTEIKNTKAKFTISDLIPKTYDLIIRYEGDEDYFKAIHHQNYTVHKRPTNMSINISEIYYGDIGIVSVSLKPESVSTQAYMYITDETNKTTKKTVYVRDGTELKLKNYAAGTYNITIELWENIKYESSNATAIFKVNKYETNLTINASDIDAGETEYLNITLSPKGEVAGEAILQINNHTQIIFLKNGQNTIKIENLTGGIYHVTVTYPGDKKYAPSNTTAVFTVKKLQTDITAKIENNTLFINTTPNSTGKVQIFINDDIYEVNLTNSTIEFPINFTKAENYIFIYYQGDGYYNYTTTNLTYEYEELVNLTGYDTTSYNSENATYHITLTDEEGYGITNKTITLTLNNKKYTLTTTDDGSAILNIKLNTGKYTITAQYRNQTTSNTITILEDAFLTGNNTKAYENVDFTYSAKLTDHKGNPIKNAEITFKINGKTYTNTTNNKGTATLNLNLKEGNYTITTTYKTVKHTNNIIIVDDSHLVGNDIKAYANDNFTYKATLTDHNNKAIQNATITFKINGKTYTNTTNNKGTATLNLNLKEGNYTITTTYKNTTITNNIQIIEDYMITGNDVKAFSETNFQYKVKLTDHKGNAVTNAKITFEINKKTYTNTTNNKGEAILNLNLKTGTYTIKVSYSNTTTTNNIQIIEDYMITGNDIKAYEDDEITYKVTLTDHNNKAIQNAEITFNIDGKTYTNTTNSKGEATINLNLKEGNYTITTTYKNTTNTNEIEIVEDHMLIGQNIKAYENNDFTYTITLKRTDGTPLTNKEITFIINNRRYTNTTNSEGKASKTLNLPEGNYTITAIYKNTRITNNLTIIEDYNIEGNNIKAYSEQDFQYKVNLTNHDKKPMKNAEITFTINGQTYKNKTDNNGQATINLNLKTGNYEVTTAYRDVKITNKLEIIETYQITGINVKSYENFDFEYIITLKNHNNKTIENAEITFEINGETYKNKTDANGEAKITLNLKKGNYTIKAIYNNTSTSNQFEIIEYDLERIISSDIEMFYHDGTRFRIQLLNQTTPLAKKTVQITINGVPYTRTTNENGSTSIPLSLNSGTYTVTTKYNNIEQNNTVTIKPTINGNDITKMFRNDTQYYATFYTNKGEILKNTQINFNINGVFYTRTTNENGTAKMNINLNQGEYIITATNPETGEQHSNTITVLSKIQENKDITKYYRNDTQYIVKIIKSDGTTAQKGEKVTFNINGVFYTRTTNETGYAKLNINLEPNEYTITAEYEGCKVSNKITVLPILKAQDLSKKYGQSKAFEATLLNGQGNPQANERITFNINGVFYTRTTNENGTAKLNINLQPGEYIITTSYNGSNIANTVKVEA